MKKSPGIKIHKSAIVAKGARIGAGVSIGPYSVIGKNVVLGKGTSVGSFCVIENNATVGERCRIFTGAVIGSIPQDLKYDGAPTSVVIGDDNIVREYVTINLSTNVAQPTRVGSHNLIMAYSHIAHDCVVGNHCIIANNGTLAGHVTLEDRAVVGGLVAIHQFCRLGTMCIVGGCSKVVTDLPPYTTCDGHPARYYGLNLVGLRRAGISREAIRDLKAAYKILMQSGFTKQHAVGEIRKTVPEGPEIKHLIDFVTTSTRGICHGANLTD